jgi:hypothetical protein
MLSNNKSNMKKIIIILSILFLFSFNVLAQEPTTEPTPEPSIEPFTPLLEPAQLLATPLPNQIFRCVFSNPVYWDNTNNLFRALEGNPIHYAQTQTWNWTNLNCEYATSLMEAIKNPTTGAEYYLTKTFSYGDILFIVFISIFLIYFLLKAIWDFFFANKNI